MSISLFVGDEQPPWVVTETVNGSGTDYSTGWTFAAKIVNAAGTTLLTKSSGIAGGTAGQITVTFTGAELSGNGVTATFANTPQTFTVYLKGTHSTFGDLTIKDTLVMEWAP